MNNKISFFNNEVDDKDDIYNNNNNNSDICNYYSSISLEMAFGNRGTVVDITTGCGLDDMKIESRQD